MTVGQEIFARSASHQNNFAESISSQFEEAEVSGPTCRSTCDHCGSRLIEIRMKLVCAECHTICETCCEGGRG